MENAFPQRGKKEDSSLRNKGKNFCSRGREKPASLHTTEEGKCLSPTRQRKATFSLRDKGKTFFSRGKKRAEKGQKGKTLDKYKKMPYTDTEER